MNEYLNILSKSPLFHDFSNEEILEIFNSLDFSIKKYKKDTVAFLEGDNCDSIGIILNGAFEIQKIYPSGNIVTLTKLFSGDIFGEALIFSEHASYPGSGYCQKDSTIIYISRLSLVSLCQKNPNFLMKFMSLLSSKILFLNKKVTLLSFKTLRQKISFFLLDEFNKTKNNLIDLKMSKKNLAEYLGVQRPSLSRELIRMAEDNLILVQKSKIKILSIEELEDILLQ